MPHADDAPIDAHQQTTRPETASTVDPGRCPRCPAGRPPQVRRRGPRARWRFRVGMLIALLGISACTSRAIEVSGVPELPPTSPAHLRSVLASTAQPAVVNVWASWCIPCRSEAPLLRAAHARFGDKVQFIGIDVQDNQADARAFIAEFGLEGFDHYFDPNRSVPNDLGRRGVPITFFFEADGALASVHSGVIDERTLAAGIDDLLEG